MTDDKKDIKRKIGKRGLSSLLNVDEPEPERTRYGYPYRDTRPNGWPEDDNQRRFFDDVPQLDNGRRAGRYAGHNSFARDTAHLGSRLSGAQSNPYVPPFVVDEQTQEAVFSEAQIRRLSLDLCEDLRRALKKYDMNLRFGHERIMRDLIEDLLLCGEMRISVGNGKYLTVNLDDFIED